MSRPPAAELQTAEPPFDLGDTGRDLYAATAPIAFADPENDWAWARYCAALSRLLDVISTMVRDDADGNPGWTALASPARCPEPWLRVLAQWAGVRRWDAMSSEDLRELIGPRAPGLWRGTRYAMIDAARRFLPRPIDPNGYPDLILSEQPAAYWRLGESPGETIAADAVGRHPGTYVGAQRPNLVRNPSLEADLSSWVGNAGTALTRVTDRAWAGVASAYIRRVPLDGAYSECSMALNATGVAAVPIKGGESYTLTAAIYPIALLAPQRPWVSFIWYDAAGTQIIQTTASITDPTPLDQWTRISATRVAPDNARFIRYYVGLYSGNIGDGAAVVEGHVDGVQLTQTSAIVPYSDTQAITLGQFGAIASSGGTALRVGGSAPPAAGSYVQAPYSSLLYAPTMTFEAWTRIPPGANPQTVWSAAWSAGGHLVRIEPNGSVAFFVHRTDESSDYANLGTPPGAIHGEAYQHIVCTVERDLRQRIYVDGTLRATSTNPLASVSVPAAGTLYVGGHYTSAFGLIDQAAIYDHPLSAASIAEHYAAGRRMSPPDPESSLYFEERADGDPYKLRVFTYSFVEHDPEQVRVALEQAKPAGLTLIYEVRHGQTWLMLRNRGYSWAEVNANYASWTAVLTDEPTSQETR